MLFLPDVGASSTASSLPPISIAGGGADRLLTAGTDTGIGSAAGGSDAGLLPSTGATDEVFGGALGRAGLVDARDRLVPGAAGANGSIGARDGRCAATPADVGGHDERTGATLAAIGGDDERTTPALAELGGDDARTLGTAPTGGTEIGAAAISGAGAGVDGMRLPSSVFSSCVSVSGSAR